MAPFVPLQDVTPRYILDKPATPALVEKIDRLNRMFHECMLLRKEIEQDWIRLTREERERFQHISASSQIRKLDDKRTSRPKADSAQPKKRRFSLLDQIEAFRED